MNDLNQGMTDGNHEILFHGKEYLLIGDLKRGGPIATKEQYENGEISFAYLKPSGMIARFDKWIGKREDIVFKKNAIAEAQK